MDDAAQQAERPSPVLRFTPSATPSARGIPTISLASCTGEGVGGRQLCCGVESGGDGAALCC